MDRLTQLQDTVDKVCDLWDHLSQIDLLLIESLVGLAFLY